MYQHAQILHRYDLVIPREIDFLRRTCTVPSCLGWAAGLSETDRRLDELWQWFDKLNPPSTEQMDELLEKLLAQPPDTT